MCPPHLCYGCCRVHYYFAQINTTTDVMTDLFAKQYAHRQSAVFKVMKHVDAASSFVPMVVASIRCVHLRRQHAWRVACWQRLKKHSLCIPAQLPCKLPLLLGCRDSMKRSAFFSKPSVASSSAAGSAKARGGDTMFHSIL